MSATPDESSTASGGEAPPEELATVPAPAPVADGFADDEATMSSMPSVEDEGDSQPPPETPDADSASRLSATNDSVTNPDKPKFVRPLQETLHVPVNPMDVIEYEWPVKSGERWFIQEQIAELLDVKSFKRKYSEMTRRLVEVEEKDYLTKTFPSFVKTVGEHLMHGLAALRALEVHELMTADYPSLYAEVQRATMLRVKAELAAKQKELEEIKKDKTKLLELRKKAMESARDYNSDLNAVKKAERRFYWDVQTSIIQSSSNQWMRLSPEKTAPSPYPCALMVGQYASYYRKFTPAEMRRLPLNSVLDHRHLFAVNRAPSPPPIIVKEAELLAATVMSEKVVSAVALSPVPPSPLPGGMTGTVGDLLRSGGSSVKRKASALDDKEKPRKRACTLCHSADPTSPLLQCASCSSVVHSDCIDMPDAVVEVAKTYPWNCIECKKCTICDKPDDEDIDDPEEKILFCDICDRGYHTFCVGLDGPPDGQFVCDKYCRSQQVAAPPAPKPAPEVKEPAKKRAKRDVIVVKKEEPDEEEQVEEDAPASPAPTTPAPDKRTPSAVLAATPVTTRRSARRAAALANV